TGVSCPEDCLAVCPAGLRGAACDTPCADAPRCTGAVTCDRYGDGAPTACEGCVAGTWGTTCASDCALATCAGVVSCDPDDGVVTGCTQCAAGWFGALCDSDWYDPAFAYRAPLTVTASDYSGAASYVHVPVDVDAICYGTRLPPTLYSFGLDEGPGGDHVDSLDGHGGFAPLEHGGAFVAGHDGRGSALSLNGASDWVDLPDVVPSTGTMTLAAWVRPSALPTTGYPAVVSAWGTVNVSGGEVYLMALAQDAACSNGDGQGGVRLMMKTHPVGQAEHSECTAKIAADSWVFAALTYSGRVERSYLDGAQQTSHDYGSSAGLEAASAVRLGLARDLATHFAGAVDDVRLYDGYLDDTDVQALMAPRCRRDLGDLRFVDRATGALLPYWAESDHRVQLRVPVASLAHTIDVYYGAPDAASGSDGDATFDFFEDFSGGLDKWTVTSGCSGSGAATLRYGKLEGTGDCAVLTSAASLDGLRRNAYMDLFRDGTETAACADGRVGFGGINVFAIPRLNLAGADQVNLGTRTTCGGNAGQPDQLDLGTIGLVQGHSDYFEAAWYPLRGTLFALTYAGYQFATAKGAVEVHATGSASTPRWYDNVRVTSPATTSSSSFGAPCRQATGSCASYRWIDLGPRTEPLTVRACPANGKSSTQTCNAANLGRRVHIDTDLPSAIKFKGFTDTVPAGVVPGGAGTAATLSPDGTSLLWSATWANCPEESVAMVTVEHVYECQLVE
ncbi:MAG: DUF2341 domain-containing protein, partial [Myxococcales bacterium]|nr:DUF2341 domain-containing protein [Myxococcales bacterium]